ncbi:MAG TPA: hypothetical protein VKT25_06105 [Ktedonobacteraceae bacterium]|nr:hypothetical protein [Ktedonobacteraceae bacterium]
MNDFGANHDSTPTNAGRRQLVMAAQLYRDAARMNHIDQLFLWLAKGIATSFQVQVIQFWATRQNRMGQRSVELRACEFQGQAVPQPVVINNSVIETAESLLSGRYSNLLQPVQLLFSTYQASTLSRFGLNFCSCTFMRSRALLPPAYDALSAQLIPTPMAVAALAYYRQPPMPETVSAINLIIEQAVPIAESQHLLLPASSSSGHLPSMATNIYQMQSPPSLYELIPRAKADDSLISSNPLSGSSVIANKQARRLYAALDGRRNVKDICEHLRLDLQEVLAAMRILARQGRIQLYEPGGQVVDAAVLDSGL